MLTALYSFTLFLSAALMFCAEPMIARMLLPSLGGSPSVWNTCMVFFQAALLGGYALAHGLTSRSPARLQRVVTPALLAAGFLSLPIGLNPARLASLPESASPVPWLLVTLVLMAGIPFLAIATLAPLLQRWFSHAGAGRKADPYFLYAASNAGSLLALIAYPALIEPHLGLMQQARAWAWAYGGLVLLVALCALATRGATLATGAERITSEGGYRPVYWSDRVAWMTLAAVPSSLLLGTTTFLTTDIASIPLLWVVPLALYLVTFILAFSPRTGGVAKWSARLLPFGVIALGFAIIMRATGPVWLVLPLHLVVFFLAAWSCHARLVSLRPEPRHLTEFYLWLAAGGALGGSFNALIAPLLFQHVHEYPLMIVAACALGAEAFRMHKRAPAGWLLVAGVAVVVGVLTLLASPAVRALGMAGDDFAIGVGFAIPLSLSAILLRQPRAFSLALGCVLFAAAATGTDPQQTRVKSLRSFFGVSEVARDRSGRFTELLHGNTIHGRQFIDPARRCEPLTYYHQEGPFADVYRALTNRTELRVAAIGLGTGAMITYARPQDDWTYFEIDPATIQIALDPSLFTFLTDCSRVPLQIVKGDARLRLRESADGEFDLIALDAFSSDAIPVHLLTREAFALYRRKLKPGGMITMHISNRYLNLDELATALAADAGWKLRIASDPDDNMEEGKSASEWATLVEDEKHLGFLGRRARWVPPDPVKVPVWTDNYSSLMPVFVWR